MTIACPIGGSPGLTFNTSTTIIVACMGVTRKATHYGTELWSPPFDVALSGLASSQHGVVAHWQLLARGMSSSGIRSRVARGRLHRLHRGVYAVGHPVLTSEARWLAGVLACGRGAVISHRSAATLWGFLRSQVAMIDVTTVRKLGRSRNGIDVHVVRSLDPVDVTSLNAVPCTNVARTLLDLADIVDRRSLERACDQAEVVRLFDGRALEDVLARAAGRRGASILRSVLHEHEIGETLTESELEERFLTLCFDAGIRQPRVNAWIALDGGAVKVDFLWPNQRLVVETDGRRVHGSRRAFEQDRRRDQRLLLAGYRVVRCTWRQIVRHPHQVTTTVSALLADD